MIESQGLTFSPTPLAIAFGIGLVLAGIILAFVAMKRSGFKRMIVILEILRVLLLTMVGVAICQPEWFQSFLPSTEPVLAVLWDDSASMNTEDIVADTQSQPAGTTSVTGAAARSRRELIKPLIENQFWEQAVADRKEPLKVIFEPFSSDLANPKSATDINNALSRTQEKNPNLRGVVLISDGSWNLGNTPAEAATQLRMSNVPVYSVVVGSEIPLPDLELASVDAPTFGVVNKPTRIPLSIASTMPKDVEVEVRFSSSDGDKLTNRVTLPANGTLQSTFVWSPKKIGDYQLTVEVEQAEGERITTNNRMTVPIEIRRESLKVLVVESYPRYEFRYLKNALTRDPGVEVKCVLYHPDITSMGGGRNYLDKFPETVDELTAFDVIMLGDVGVGNKQLTADDCRRIKGLVQNQATGLILMPGFRGLQQSLAETELSDLIPIVFDPAQPRGWGNPVPAQFQLTEAGSMSLLTKLADSAENNLNLWNRLPGFQWYAPVQRAKVGAQVLAVHSRDSNSEGRIPLLVTKTFGSGKILFMGTDGAWRWREGVEDKYHYRFWGQVVRWMAYQRNMAGGDSMRLFYTPDRPRAGKTLSLNANVMSNEGEPLQNGDVNVQIIAPSGNTQSVKLASQAEAGQWGLFTGSFLPLETGEHQATLTCRETGATLNTTISVQGLQRERLGQPVNLPTMQEIASITRGKLVTPEKIEDILTAIREMPEPEPQIRRVRIWSHPLWAGTIVGLLTVFWIGRKFAGVV